MQNGKTYTVRGEGMPKKGLPQRMYVCVHTYIHIYIFFTPMQNGKTYTVRGEGMPKKGGPQRGNLIVEFTITTVMEKQAANAWAMAKSGIKVCMHICIYACVCVYVCVCVYGRFYDNYSDGD